MLITQLRKAGHSWEAVCQALNAIFKLLTWHLHNVFGFKKSLLVNFLDSCGPKKVMVYVDLCFM